MKKIKYIFALFFSVIIAGCNFLEIMPETTMVDKDFYKTEKDVQLSLYSTYASLRDNGLYNTSIWAFADLRSDIAFTAVPYWQTEIFKYEIEEFNITANNSILQNHWTHSYRGITRANSVIIKGEELFGDNEEVQTYIQEAKVLRALFYFNLVRVFGDVPIIQNIPNDYSDSSDDIRQNVELVYEQILKDLSDAINSDLLKPQDTTPTGRISIYAAKALMAKVLMSIPDEITQNAYPNVSAYKDISNSPRLLAYFPGLTSNKWEAAKFLLEDIVKNGKYQLMENFSDLFNPENKHNSESLWEVEYMGGQTEYIGSPFYTLFTPTNYQPRNTPNTNGYIPSALPNKGTGNCMPTGYFMDFAKKWDSFWYNYQNPTLFDGGIYCDKRLSDGNYIYQEEIPVPVNQNKDYPQSLTNPYDSYSGTTFRLTVKGFNDDNKYFCGKYMSGTPYRANDSNDNWYILRYSDVLLMLAEATAHLTQVLTQEDLDRTINAVRIRAGIIPYLNSGTSDCGRILDSNEKVLQAIYEERALELAFEGHRWFDLVRTGKAVTVMNEHFTKYFDAFASNPGSTVNSYYMKNKRISIDEYCTLFPVPTKEILLNPKLTQNENAR